jgi:hypothetical protein
MKNLVEIIKGFRFPLLLAGISASVLGCIAFSVSSGMYRNQAGGAVLPLILVAASVTLFLAGALFLIVGVYAVVINDTKTYIPPVESKPISDEARRKILQQEINRYVLSGYRVVSQTDTTAQLVRPKQFSCLWFLINAFLIIGWIFYLLWYWSQQDEQIYIEVDRFGGIHTTR